VDLPNQEPEEVSPEDYFRRKLGLNLSTFDLSGKAESPEERDSRLRREEEAHSNQQKLIVWKFLLKDAAGYTVAIILVIVLVVLSVSILKNSSSAQADKDWAKTTLAAISSVVAGYLFGKSNSA
jgi:hypothetical protein